MPHEDHFHSRHPNARNRQVSGHDRDDPLALDRETMRMLGYRTVDLLIEQLHREEPPLRRATPGEMRKRLHGPPPEDPYPFNRIL